MANRLATSSSLYLRKHAENPVGLVALDPRSSGESAGRG
jgi:hypothetical protein